MDITKLPVLGYFLEKLDEADFEYGIFATGLATIMLIVFFTNTQYRIGTIISIIFYTAPIWLPWLSLKVFHAKYMDFVGKKLDISQGRVTLEIKIPQEVLKSPEAMETVISQMWNKATPDNFWETYIDGKRPPRYGLEMVSFGGDVRFYINTRVKKFKNITETQLYAQYPGIEVEELAVDYAAALQWDPDKYEYFSMHMRKKRDEEMPIKTYKENGLADMPKEEEKVDPMVALVELLGTVKPHEKLCIQFIIFGHREAGILEGNIYGPPPKAGEWKHRVQAKIDEVMGRNPEDRTAPAELEGTPRLTQSEREDAEALERAKSQYPYRVGIRWIYQAKKGHFNGDMLTVMLNAFRSFDTIGRQEIGMAWRTDFNYMWFSDPFGTEVFALKRQELVEYKLRKYFNKNQLGNTKIFTPEELATMFHLPGKVALTPTLNRIPSTRSEAPANLPTGNPS